MRFLPLTRGMYAMVDDEDFDRLRFWKWHVQCCGPGKLYASRSVKIEGKTYARYLHHEVLKLEIPLPRGIVVDHINGESLDCRKENLRCCSPNENMVNCGPRLVWGKTSKYKGVHYDRREKRWIARFSYKGRHYGLGRFKDEYTAVVIFNRAVCKVIGACAYVNRWEGPTEPAPGEVPERAKNYYAPILKSLKIALPEEDKC